MFAKHLNKITICCFSMLLAGLSFADSYELTGAAADYLLANGFAGCNANVCTVEEEEGEFLVMGPIIACIGDTIATSPDPENPQFIHFADRLVNFLESHRPSEFVNCNTYMVPVSGGGGYLSYFRHYSSCSLVGSVKKISSK